jgi:hypothetical protein
MLSPILAGILYTRNPIMVYPVSLGLIGVALIVTIFLSPHDKGETIPILFLPPEI